MVGIGLGLGREKSQRDKGGEEKMDKSCARLGMAGRFPTLSGWNWAPYWH